MEFEPSSSHQKDTEKLELAESTQNIQNKLQHLLSMKIKFS